MNKKLQFVPSVIYKQTIDQLCRPLNSIGQIKYFVLYVIFNNGKKFVISSTPENFLSMYWQEKLFEHDQSSDNYLFDNANFYLCDEKLGSTLYFKEVIEARFQMYRTFYVSRTCPECQFVFGALTQEQVVDPVSLYYSVIDKFEDFCTDFLDDFSTIIKFHHPEYRRSIILNDRAYRKSIIKRTTLEQPLTNREIECLYWAAQGKSSDETAMILNIKKYTIEFYRKSIKQKLNCSSMAHAVYEGVKRGYIGAFHQLNQQVFDVSKQKYYLINDKNS